MLFVRFHRQANKFCARADQLVPTIVSCYTLATFVTLAILELYLQIPGLPCVKNECQSVRSVPSQNMSRKLTLKSPIKAHQLQLITIIRNVMSPGTRTRHPARGAWR